MYMLAQSAHVGKWLEYIAGKCNKQANAESAHDAETEVEANASWLLQSLSGDEDEETAQSRVDEDDRAQNH